MLVLHAGSPVSAGERPSAFGSWESIAPECDGSDLQRHSCVFAASLSCPSSLLGRPFLTEQQQLGRCCFRLLLLGGDRKREETSLSPEAGIGGGAGGHVSLAILPSVTE